MKKVSKKFLFAVSIILSLAFASVASAEYDIVIDCPRDGNTYSVWVTTQSNVLDDDLQPVLPILREYCVPLLGSDDFLTFGQMSGPDPLTRPLLDAWATDDIEFLARSPFLTATERRIGARHRVIDEKKADKDANKLKYMLSHGEDKSFREAITADVNPGPRYTMVSKEFDGAALVYRYEIEEFRRFYYKLPVPDAYLFFAGVYGRPEETLTDITWTPNSENRYDYKHGETKTVILTVAPKKAGETISISCLKIGTRECRTVGRDIVGFRYTNNANPAEVQVTFNTRKMVNLFGLTPPSEIEITLRATTSDPKQPKYRDAKIVVGIGDFECSTLNKSNCHTNNRCFFFPAENKCVNRRNPTICPKLPQNLCGKQADGSPSGEICTWQRFGKTDDKGAYTPDPEDKCQSPVQAQETATHQRPAGYTRDLIPNCAWSGSCRNLNTLVEVLISYGKIVFRFIGGLALVMAVIGGFTMVLSMGNPEKVKKGRDILGAAIIGIIIVFTAFLIVSFLLEALQVGSDFRAPGL